jgi:oligopeptide transport system substrate-binding protein
MCEGLTISNPKGGDNLPGVAKSWSISPDGKTYTFFLNENAKWSNGDPVIAEDFVWSWMRILTPSLGSQYPDMLYYLKGAADYHQGITNDFSTVGVKAIDKYLLQVELKNPTPFFIKLLSHYSTYPVHKETVLAYGSIDDRNGQWTRPGNFVCNGPMNLKSWELNKQITVEKNPLYWDAKKVRLNEIRFYPVSNESTEDRMFRAGQLHVTNVVPLEKCPVYIEKKNPNLRIEPYMGTYFYRVNTKHPVLKDKRIRLALAYAINREQIVKKVSKCGQHAAYSFTPPGSAGYEPQTNIPYDPELARSLLAEAGYANGDNFPILEILFNTQEGHRKIALAIQQMWQENLGISIQLVNQDWKVYLAREMTGDFQISRAGWIGDYEDPNTFLDLLRLNRGNNKTGWENIEYDQLLELANSTNDQVLRYEYLNQAEKLLISEMPIIPIYTYVRQYQISSDVKGWHPNIIDTHHPKYIYLERE